MHNVQNSLRAKKKSNCGSAAGASKVTPTCGPQNVVDIVNTSSLSVTPATLVAPFNSPKED